MQTSQELHCPPDISESFDPQVRPGDPPPRHAAAAEPGDDAPYWLPRGDAWRRLSEPIRRAVHQRILPMWRELVDGAADELERSALRRGPAAQPVLLKGLLRSRPLRIGSTRLEGVALGSPWALAIRRQPATGK
jgi:hypothetical protein